MWHNLAVVCLGGALGAGLRYLINSAALQWLGPSFPWGTLAVNVVGSFLMGLVAQWLIMRTGFTDAARLFLMTGVLGGFTTFSAFSLDVALLLDRGATSAAMLYVVASVAGSILALFAGQMTMRLAIG